MNKLIELNCDTCGILYEIKRPTYYSRKRNCIPNLCKECMRKYNIKNKKDRWNNLSEEEKEKYSQRTKDQLSKRTTEEWRIINKKNSEGLKKHWSTVSKEDKNKRIMPMLEAARKSWENLSEEEKYERTTKWMKNKSEEEINLRMYELSQRMKEYNDSLTYEEKVRRANHMNECLKKMSKKDKDILYIKSHKWIYDMSIEESWQYYKDNLKYMIPYLNNKENKLEIEFIDILKSMNIDMSIINTQYINEIVNNDILNEFPNIRNPYHIWDFRIKLNDRDIYVDIDGSMHSISKGTYVTKDGFDVGDYVQDKDNRRKYQTDGLDSYVVLAYNDKIDNGTKVMRIKDESIISFKDLMNIISTGLLSEKEIKKILNIMI